MNKPDLQNHCDAMAAAIRETLHLIRDETGSCKCCGAFKGSAHVSGCVVWPIIRARGAYSSATDLFSLVAPETQETDRC